MKIFASRMFGKFNTFFDKLNNFCCVLSGICMVVIGIIVTYEIIMRYFFRSPTEWFLEISIYLCLTSVFLAVGYTQKDKSNISIDFISLRLCKQEQIIIEFLTSILAILFVLILIWKGGILAIDSYTMGETSPTVLKVPVFIPRGLVPIGGMLLLLELLRNIFDLILKMEMILKKGTDEGHYLPKGLFTIIFVVLFAVGVVILMKEGLAPIGIVILLFLLLFSGLPIAYTMGFVGTLGFFFIFGGFPMLVQIPLVAYKTLDDFVIVAVPMFIMTSTILMIGKVGEDLFELASKWVRHLPGGLAVSAICASAVFAAISGSSSATVATIGIIAIPAMISRGYPRELTYGTVAIGGILGPLIPPSIFMILIGSMTGDSVGKLFMAGMLPGIMLAVMFSIYIIIQSKNNKSIPKMAPCPWGEKLRATVKSFWGLLTPVIILGGIYSGIFTPTESAAIGVTYSLFITIFIYRTVSLKNFYHIFIEGAKLNCMILFLLAGALIFGQLIAMMEVPKIICGFFASLPLSPMSILILVMIFIIFLGALMDELSILLIIYPILYFIFVQHFNFDSIWFALVFVFTLETGFVLPPVGMNIFIVQGIEKTAKFEEVVKGVWPFTLILLVSILIVIYFKPLSMWLPKLIG